MPAADVLNSEKWKNPSVTADLVLICKITEEDLPLWAGWQEEHPNVRGESPKTPGDYVLLIGRANPPYPASDGYYCLPGGFVDYGEDPYHAAARELGEETNIIDPKNEDQVATVMKRLMLVDVFGQEYRDPRRHVITLAFVLALSSNTARRAYGGDDAKWCQWVAMNRVCHGGVKLGFDHWQIAVEADAVYQEKARHWALNSAW